MTTHYTYGHLMDVWTPEINVVIQRGAKARKLGVLKINNGGKYKMDKYRDIEIVRKELLGLKTEEGFSCHLDTRIGGYTISLYVSNSRHRVHKEITIVSGEAIWLSYKDVTDSEISRCIDFIADLAENERHLPEVNTKTIRGMIVEGKYCTYHGITQGLNVLRTFVGDFKIELENPIFLGRFASVESCERMRVVLAGNELWVDTYPTKLAVKQMLFFLDYVSQLDKNIERGGDICLNLP